MMPLKKKLPGIKKKPTYPKAASITPLLPVKPGAGEPLPKNEPFIASYKDELITQYLIDTSYQWDNGTLLMPRAGPAGTAPAVVKMKAPTCYKIVEWTAECVGGWPTLPHWDTGNPAERLMHKEIAPCSWLPGPIGVPVCRISGLYIYAFASTPDDDQPLIAGGPPDSGTTPDSSKVPALKFSKDILKSPATPAGGTKFMV